MAQAKNIVGTAAVVFLIFVTLDQSFEVTAMADPGHGGHGHGHGHGHGGHIAGGTACIVKGSYCQCHYCKCEKGHVSCKGHGHGGYGEWKGVRSAD